MLVADCFSSYVLTVKSMPDQLPVLVSACLLGRKCRYDGSTNPSESLQDKLKNCRVIPVCPEELGGLPTPRPAAHLTGGDGHAVLAATARVITRDTHTDVTDQFLAGAHLALDAARQEGVRRAYLKARSPSCGCCQTYVDGELVEGQGVTAALLQQAGIEVIDVDAPKAE